MSASNRHASALGVLSQPDTSAGENATLDQTLHQTAATQGTTPVSLHRKFSFEKDDGHDFRFSQLWSSVQMRASLPDSEDQHGVQYQIDPYVLQALESKKTEAHSAKRHSTLTFDLVQKRWYEKVTATEPDDTDGEAQPDANELALDNEGLRDANKETLISPSKSSPAQTLSLTSVSATSSVHEASTDNKEESYLEAFEVVLAKRLRISMAMPTEVNVQSPKRKSGVLDGINAEENTNRIRDLNKQHGVTLDTTRLTLDDPTMTSPLMASPDAELRPTRIISMPGLASSPANSHLEQEARYTMALAGVGHHQDKVSFSEMSSAHTRPHHGHRKQTQSPYPRSHSGDREYYLAKSSVAPEVGNHLMTRRMRVSSWVKSLGSKLSFRKLKN